METIDINKDINKRKRKKIKNVTIRKIKDRIFNEIKKKGIKNGTIGICYFLFHCLIIFLIGYNLIFNINIIHLIVLLIIVSLDAFSIVILHGCPLTILEERYLGINTCEERTQQLKNMGIFYSCDHEYEKQIELLINVGTLIIIKILILLTFRTFNLKLNNYNNLYN
jgi:hypothetical protein